MDNKPSFRTKKIELSIKRLVSEYLVTHRDYLNKFPDLRFEITSVKVSKDLRFAKIFLIHNITEEEFTQFNKLYLHGIQNLIANREWIMNDLDSEEIMMLPFEAYTDKLDSNYLDDIL